MSDDLKRYNWFGNEQVKVFCLNCKHSFPANVKWLNLDWTGPQFYKDCPFCKGPSRVKIVRGSLF